jgi:hypothetical protein
MIVGEQRKTMSVRFIPLGLALALASGAVLPVGVFGEPTNGPLAAFGLTNVPLGQSTLEVVDDGVLFVHDAGDGGVSVLLGEADSGVFLYPLTGYVYEGDWMTATAYGRFGGSNQVVSRVAGTHSGNSSGTVTVDFTAQGATRLSAFIGSTFLGQITNSIAYIEVLGNGQGCRANPWWRLPDGSFGAMVELATPATVMSIALAPDRPVEVEGGTSIFIRPDDPTNTVDYISRVDVTSGGFSSFCITDARVGMFHHGHKALGRATLSPTANTLVVGNLGGTIVSNVQDGVLVELPSVSSFDLDLFPLELPGTNASVSINGFGTSGLQQFSALGTAVIDNPDGSLRIGVEMGIAPQTTDVQVRSNGVLVGTASMPSSERVNLSGTPRLTGCAIFGKTLEMRPGFAVRVDRPTAFTAGGQTFEGDEVRLLAPEPVVFETLESFVIFTKDLASLTISGERSVFPSVPALNVSVSTNHATLSWPDPNRLYIVEASTTFTNAFEIVPQLPVVSQNTGTLTLDLSESGQRFFRLQRRMPGSD